MPPFLLDSAPLGRGGKALFTENTPRVGEMFPLSDIFLRGLSGGRTLWGLTPVGADLRVRPAPHNSYPPGIPRETTLWGLTPWSGHFPSATCLPGYADLLSAFYRWALFAASGKDAVYCRFFCVLLLTSIGWLSQQRYKGISRLARRDQGRWPWTLPPLKRRAKLFYCFAVLSRILCS